MLNAPFTYEQLNSHLGQIPQSFIHVHNTGIARFFKRYLLMDALSVFDWILPDHWDADYFRYVLMGFGHVVVFKTDIFGVIPQYGELYGYNVFYRPNRAKVVSPLIRERDMLIGKECSLIMALSSIWSIITVI